MGLAQILGINCGMVGFNTARAMFDAFSQSESAQIVSFFAFVTKRKGLLDALKNKDWVTAAKLYNGVSSQQNLYASKIEKFYVQFKQNGVA
jgi:hypothetical protein